jgi:DNA gyrase subunit B
MSETIRLLEGLEAIRLRPGMFIGGTDSRAMLSLVLRVVQEQAEMAAAGVCHEIQVHLLDNNTVTIANDSPGWLRLGQPEGKGLRPEDYLAMLPVPGFFSEVVCANAVSTDFRAEFRRDGEVVKQSFQRGVATGSARRVRDLKAGESTGVTVTFTLDPTIFVEGASLSYPDLYARLRELAFLVPGVRLKLFDERQAGASAVEFCYEHGLADLVRYLNRDCVPFHEVICQSHEVNFKQLGIENASYTLKIDFAIQFTDCAKPFQLSFVGCCETRDGGTHIDALRRGLRDAILDAAREQRLPVERRNDRFFKGMTAVIRVWHPYPQFAGCTRQRLASVDMSVVYPLVYRAVAEALLPLRDFLERPTSRVIPDQQRRYGDLAEQMRHFTVLCW